MKYIFNLRLNPSWMPRIRTMSLGLILIFGFGCADSGPVGSFVEGFYLDPHFTAQQSQLLTEDLHFLKTIPDHSLDSDLIQILKMPDSSGQNILRWIGLRTHFLLPEAFNLDQKVFIEQHNFSYENPTLFPKFDSGTELQYNHSSMEFVLANNLSSVIYLQGKESKNLLSVKIDGMGPVIVSSPRTGMIQLRNYFFTLHQFKGFDLDGLGQRLFRLSILIHESRHSDGNGVSLGFFHSVCPDWHVYSKQDVCDQNSNGAYRTSALFLRSMLHIHQNLSPVTKSALQAILLDFYIRTDLSKVHPPELKSLPKIQGNVPTVNEWDETPEGRS